MREVLINSAGGKFAQDITVGSHQIRADEETEQGGDGTGPGPHELLLAALGSCTSMTLKSYADRKGWLLRAVQVKLTGGAADGQYVITREIDVDGDLDREQRQRLLEIAEKCPVHRTLTGTIVIKTTGVPP